MLLMTPPGVLQAQVVQSAPASAAGSIPAASLPWIPPFQEWFGEPVLPVVFHIELVRLENEDGAEFDSDSRASLIVSLEIPPLAVLPTFASQEPPSSRFPEAENQESTFPRGITERDIQTWRKEDDLRRVRKWAGDLLFGIPLVVPQLLVETLLPRGIPVGPTTFFYRESTPGSSMALVVFDQILFHEAQFISQAQAYSTNGTYGPNFNQIERHVLRQSLMGGFRATYAMPKLTMNLVLETAADQGALGYLLLPVVGGGLLYLKGIDEKFGIGDSVQARFKLASGQQCVRGTRSTDGMPAFSFEVRFCDFPVGVVGSFEVSSHGTFPAFIGLGTSLDTVEEVLGLDALGSSSPFRLR
jgi:hypothetical protein